MGMTIAVTGLVLFAFSIAVIRIFNDVENFLFRYIFVALFISSGLSIPAGMVIYVWS